MTLPAGADRAALERHIQDTPVSGDPEAMRAAFHVLADPPPAPDAESVGGVAGRWFGQGEAKAIWLHGGGFVFGSSQTHARPVALLAERIEGRIFVPDYPLAPEHTWPAQKLAIAEVFDHLGPMHLVGDSAGGQLALIVARDRPQDVRSLSLISPNTDRTGASETRQQNSPHDLMNDDQQDAALARLCFQGIATTDADASPLHSDLSTLPPTFLTASTHEVLLDDSLLLARQLGLHRIPLTLMLQRDLFHLWILWPHILPEARTKLEDIAFHITQHTAK